MGVDNLASAGRTCQQFDGNVRYRMLYIASTTDKSTLPNASIEALT